ncbi:MAG: formylglycine-generating enzyme family protein, partial [Deltaproteobacteria bacterium]|nr:formylglycine-generating enzyme family protein [Deltaproteobacteria bacterium]
NKATYPYGVAFAADKCNVDRNAIRDIVATGSFAECVSAAGIFDASGNVAEWVEGRYSYGGSAQDRTPGRCPERKAWPNPEHKQPDVGFRCCATPKK